MARQPRFDLPGVPQHIVQRGNNRLPCFLDEADRARYLHLMANALLATGCSLHACVLMDNHVHLLATPPEVGAVARLMQKLGRQYVGRPPPAQRHLVGRPRQGVPGRQRRLPAALRPIYRSQSDSRAHHR